MIADHAANITFLGLARKEELGRSFGRRMYAVKIILVDQDSKLLPGFNQAVVVGWVDFQDLAWIFPGTGKGDCPNPK